MNGANLFYNPYVFTVYNMKKDGEWLQIETIKVTVKNKFLNRQKGDLWR